MVEEPKKNKDRERHVKLFTQPDCVRCPSAEVLVAVVKDETDLIDTVTYYDVKTTDGLTEAAFNNVLSTPTIIITDGFGNISARWDGSYPFRSEFENYLVR